jgi:nitrile hydratase
MNGPHDMGGMQCYGPVRPEADEPVFHAEWEKRALALTVAMGATGAWNIDRSRHARERIEPARYLASSYYEIWIAGLETLLTEAGLATEAELESGRVAVPGKPLRKVAGAAAMAAVLAKGGPADRAPQGKPKFRAGDSVRTANLNPPGHTRLPRYARDKEGVIETVGGFHVFPDSNAHSKGEAPQWLYTVRFEAGDLFGAGADHQVHLDCWESYLEAR